MEILKRAKGNHGDLVSFSANQNEIRDEVNRRTAKAGLTTRYGEPACNTKIMSNGIGPSKLNIWPRDEHGNLID